jgi:hypothetical protein
MAQYEFECLGTSKRERDPRRHYNLGGRAGEVAAEALR